MTAVVVFEISETANKHRVPVAQRADEDEPECLVKRPAAADLRPPPEPSIPIIARRWKASARGSHHRWK